MRSRWFVWWFARHCKRRLERTFGRIRISGREHLNGLHGPAVIVSNHSAWWDPLIAIWLTQGFESYALMDAKNLARLPFFGKVGALGVHLGDPRDGARVIRMCARLLNVPRRLLWVFPQGAERPLHGPLDFKPGAAAIARLAKVPVVHVGIHYAFNEREQPDLDIIIGAPVQDVSAEAVAALLTQLPGRELVHETRVGTLAERLLAWLTHPSTK